MFKEVRFEGGGRRAAEFQSSRRLGVLERCVVSIAVKANALSPDDTAQRKHAQVQKT